MSDGDPTAGPETGAPDGRAASRRIIEAGDQARRRLARDLHDGAQQQLVAALMHLQLAQQQLTSEPGKAEQHLDAGINQAEAGLRALRELVAGIHPPILVHLGLGAAVEALVAKLPIPVRLDLTDQRIPLPIATSMYFLISEALANVIKHAHASEASVRIEVGGAQVIVEVRDNGVGGAVPAAESTGLHGLADRVNALDGELTVTSPAGAGTTLLSEVPLPTSSAHALA